MKIDLGRFGDEMTKKRRKAAQIVGVINPSQKGELDIPL